MNNQNDSKGASTVKIGWAETDITPEEPVIVAGQFYARVSEGV